MQIEAVDFDETFAPVVNWVTVRTLLILSQLFKLSTAQIDYTAAFPQADLKEDVFVEMPKGFKEKGYVLKLKKSLYGLRQSLRNFSSTYLANLKALGSKVLQLILVCLSVLIVYVLLMLTIF